MTLNSDIVRHYLEALELNDPVRILQCFSADAQIASPTYGVMGAGDFYRKLCSDTKKAEILVIGIHPSAADPLTCFALFEYLWTLQDGSKKSLSILDQFKVQDGLITSLRIFADVLRKFQ